MKDAEAVTFAGATLDRAAHLRGDAAAQAAMEGDARARCLPIWRGRPLFETDATGAALGWLEPAHPLFGAANGRAIFLGLEGGAPRFAREIAGWPGSGDLEGEARPFDEARVGHPALPGRFAFADLRAMMGALTPAEAGAAAAAKGVFAWHATHGFCARCGAASEPVEAGWRRRCPSCGAEHFPRTDPVVIMLILRGEDEVLLGRAAAWPPGMYSLLAGFMEPGESIEAAVRRETWEEAGVRVGAVEYLSSQPWPFPSSLMLGCRGRATSREIVRDPAELEDARWVTKAEVLAGIAGQDPDLRPARRGSIARFLLERWLADRLG